MDKTFLMLLEQTRIARERAEEAGRHLESYCNRSTGVRRITPDGIRGKGGHGDPTAWNVIGKITLEQNYKATVDTLLERKNQYQRRSRARHEMGAVLATDLRTSVG